MQVRSLAVRIGSSAMSVWESVNEPTEPITVLIHDVVSPSNGGVARKGSERASEPTC
jgi:hypothetical protein